MQTQTLPTQAITETRKAVDAVCAHRQVLMLTAECGAGKSTALLAAATERAILYRAEVVNTPLSLLKALLGTQGIDWRGTTREASLQLAQLVRRHRIEAVLVDDAGRLARHTLEMLRAIHERLEVGLLLAGSVALPARCQTQCAELRHHAEHVMALPPLQPHEVRQLVAARLGNRVRHPWEWIALCRALHQTSGGNVRRLLQLLSAGQALARERHRPLSVRLVRTAARGLPWAS